MQVCYNKHSEEERTLQQNLMQLTGVDLVVPTHGIEGAKAYPLGLNCRVPLFDDTEDVFYIKSTDANGFPTVKKYRFTEEVIIDPNNSGNGVALQDIRTLIREELGSIKEELINAQQPISAASDKQTKSNESSDTPAAKRSRSAKSADSDEQGQNITTVGINQDK